MIVVRNCFVAKPGQASKLAAQIKDAASAAKMPKFRVMTDLTGDFNRVIFEMEAENMSDFEARLNEYMSTGVMREKMAGYADLYMTGSREIFRVV